MYNARKTTIVAKNIRENAKSNGKDFELHCSCPNNTPFKSDQSRDHNKFHSSVNTSGKIAEESENFLRDKFIRYGLTPKPKKSTTKHSNSPRHAARDGIKKSVPEDRIMKVNSKELSSKNKCKSKTQPTSSTDRYVEDLKKEIKSKRGEIPSLPEKYKKKYLTSLRDELYLNKLTTDLDKNQQIEEIKREIETYRAHNSPFVDHLQTPKNNYSTELEITIHPKDNKLKDRREKHRTKVRKEKKSGASDRYDRPRVAQNTGRHQVHNRNKKYVNRHDGDVENSTPSPCSEGQIVKNNAPVKNYTTTSTQCEIPTIQSNDKPEDFQMAEKLEAIHDLIPKISLVIERSEKTLENAFKNVLKTPKIVQDRAVSPIKEIIGLNNVQENKMEIYGFPKTPPNSEISSNTTLDAEGSPPKPFTIQPSTLNPHAGDLILNIQSIKESRSVLDGFQNELLLLKKDIEECRICKGVARNGGNHVQNYCEKHAIYIPILRVGEQGSQRDQIKLFNALKTEAYLKNELDNQIKHIARLERKLLRARKNNDLEKLETVEKELNLAKSYFNNLLVKQQTERVLSEQQKIIKDSTGHECINIEDCDKCCLERQVHELLRKVRENITEDIEDSKQRLKIQKMPSIDIRNPLQLQNILKLNIPPSSPPQISTRSNFVFEAIIKDDEADDNFQNEAVQTKILVNKSTSVEVSTYKNKNESNITKPKKQQDDPKIDRISEDSYPKRFVKHKSLTKTPSELGFRRNVGTQCDSTTSLMESIDHAPPPTMTQTQTGVGLDDSSYLFGFKEYLMKKTGSQLVEHVDVMTQVSLDESSDTALKSTSADVDTQTVMNRRLSKVKSKEFQALLVDQINKEEQILPHRSVSTENEFSTQGSQLRSLQRTPSLKKMILPPSSFPESLQPEMEISIQNPYVEPKYRMKRFSLNKQESEVEVKQNSGDPFYKHLTDKEELPERSRLNIASNVPNTTVKGSYLNEATELEEDQNPERSYSSQSARGTNGGKKLSTENEQTPKHLMDESNLKNLSLLQEYANRSRDNVENTEQSAISQNARILNIERKSSDVPKGSYLHEAIEPEEDRKPEPSQNAGGITTMKKPGNEPEPKSLPNENNLKKLTVLPENVTKDDDKNIKQSTTSQNARRSTIEIKSSFENQLEPKRPSTGDNLENASLIQKETSEAKSDDQNKELFAKNQTAGRPSIDKKSSFKNEPQPNILASLSPIHEDLTKPDDQNSKLFTATTKTRRTTIEDQGVRINPDSKHIPDEYSGNPQNLKQTESQSKKSDSPEKLYRYVSDIKSSDHHLENLTEKAGSPTRKSGSRDKLHRYGPDISNDHLEIMNNQPEASSRNSISGEKLNEDPEISRNDSAEVKSNHSENIKHQAPKNDAEEVHTKHAQNSPKKTVTHDLGEAYSESSEDLEPQHTMVNEKNEMSENQNEPADNNELNQMDSNIAGEKLEAEDEDDGFLNGILNIEPTTEEEQHSIGGQNARTSKTTILPIFPPTYKLIVNKNNFHTKLSEKNTWNTMEPTPHSFEKFGKISVKLGEEHPRIYKDSKNKVSVSLYDADKFVITSSPYSKRVTNIVNYILPVNNNKQTLDNRPCTSKFCSEVPKISQERKKYSKRCSNKSEESSIVSSEGEVMCKCPNISAGEIHHCPRRRKNRSGINNKDKPSSHLFLEKERQHYDHWVTYYTTKKYNKDCSCSSSQSDNINDN